MLVPDTLIYAGHFLPTKSNKGRRHLSQHSSTDTPRDIRPHWIHTPRLPHPLTYTTDIDRFIHTETARLQHSSEDGIRWKMGEGRSPEHKEEENGSTGDLFYISFNTPHAVITSTLIAADHKFRCYHEFSQRLMSRLGIEWFLEDSEERFDMESAKTSQAYPSLPLIHSMMLRLSPVSRENTHTHADLRRVIHTSPLSVFMGISQLWQLIPSMSACAVHLSRLTD